ncbi:MAG: MerR family DNA-binding transcriptional regulator [Candidatus Moranbacteria bacterium]|nr:MerR family DNA-binding transcriptional regulator [Candidatus Moranbacteria bacterium]
MSIGRAAKILGVSIGTLRRWDDNQKLPAIRKSGKRFYRLSTIKKHLESEFVENSDLVELAWEWVSSEKGKEPFSLFYCSNSAVFKTKLVKMQNKLGSISSLRPIFPLITSIAGEIGNNSFDHNLGKWADIPGIFFGYDEVKKLVVLADRGQGVLETLKRVRKKLSSDEEALEVAFTEIVSGRSPEARGNGLKFVREVVAINKLFLEFQTGKAKLEMKEGKDALNIQSSETSIQGCFTVIKF